MLAYYEKLIEYWKAGKTVELYEYFNQWKKEGLLSKDEIEKLEKEVVPELEDLFIEQCEENPATLYSVCNTVKRKRGWDDKTFCKEVGISQEEFLGIKNCTSPKRKTKRIAHKVISILLEKG